MIFVFLIFPSASSNVFSLLNCSVLTDKRSHLVADLDVYCWEGEHTPYIAIAALFLFLFPFGVPFFLFSSPCAHALNCCRIDFRTYPRCTLDFYVRTCPFCRRPEACFDPRTTFHGES